MTKEGKEISVKKGSRATYRCSKQNFCPEASPSFFYLLSATPPPPAVAIELFHFYSLLWITIRRTVARAPASLVRPYSFFAASSSSFFPTYRPLPWRPPARCANLPRGDPASSSGLISQQQQPPPSSFSRRQPHNMSPKTTTNEETKQPQMAETFPSPLTVATRMKGGTKEEKL